MSLVKSKLLNFGNLIAVNPTVSIVITPPKITAGTVPINFAVAPLSKAPSSLDEPTKIEFTEATLPLNSSGVFNCKMVWRIIIETPSVSPYINKANTESQKISETPKTIIEIPKQKIAKSNFLPAFTVSGIWADAIIISTDPTAGAARKIPNPSEQQLSCFLSF